MTIERTEPHATLAAALWVLTFLIQSAAGAEETALPLLWHEASAAATQDLPFPPKKPWMIRQREITFDPQLVAVLKNASARPLPPMSIELFQGRTYELDVTSTVSRLSDLSTVRGLLKNTARTTWSLVISGNTVNGTLQVGDRLYKIEHVFNGRHRLLEVDPAKMPAE